MPPKHLSLLQRATRERISTGARAPSDDFTKTCTYCREFSVPPFFFRPSFPPEDILFNHEIAVDILWLEGRPVLHVVCNGTNFQVASALRLKKALRICERHFLNAGTRIIHGTRRLSDWTKKLQLTAIYSGSWREQVGSRYTSPTSIPTIQSAPESGTTYGCALFFLS